MPSGVRVKEKRSNPVPQKSVQNKSMVKNHDRIQNDKRYSYELHVYWYLFKAQTKY